MSESFRTTPPEHQWSGSAGPGNGYQSGYGATPQPHQEHDAGEAGKILLVGILGGVLSAAGYLVYRRLPDDQKERLQAQVRSMVQQRITELRQNFNI